MILIIMATDNKAKLQSVNAINAFNDKLEKTTVKLSALAAPRWRFRLLKSSDRSNGEYKKRKFASLPTPHRASAMSQFFDSAEPDLKTISENSIHLFIKSSHNISNSVKIK